MSVVSSHTWLKEVYSERGPTAKCRLVACALFIYMDRRGIPEPKAFPTLRTLEGRTGLSATEVRRQLQQLDADGWVIRKDRGRGQYGSTLYAYEAMIPPVANAPSTGTTIRAANAPSTAPNPLQPMRQALALISSEQAKIRNPDMCPSGTDQGLETDLQQAGGSQ
jgi:hypothetical protein